MLVIGEKEIENGVVSVRCRDEGGDIGTMTVEQLMERFNSEVESKMLAVDNYGAAQPSIPFG